MELGPTLALQLGAPSLGMASATRLMSAALDAPAFVGEFQRSVLTMVFIAMVLLGSASWLLPRVWREKAPHRRAHAGQRFALLMSRGPERLRGAFRQKALLKSPISWLAGRNPITTIALAVILTLVVISASVATRFDWGIPINPAAKAFLPYILTGLLCAGIATLSHLYLLAQLAIHSCRWIIESREGGVLELIAAGRLRRGQIISGHWRNLGRRGGPTLLAIVITTALALLWFCDIYYFESGERLRLLNFISDSFTALTRGTNEPQHFLGICFIVACFFLPVAWIALGSVGPYLALRLPKPKNVPFITLLCVLAPPFVLIMPLIGVRDYLAVCHQIKAPAGYERALWSLITLAPYLGMIGFTQFQVWRNFHELAFHNVRTGEKMITEPPAQISRTFSNFVKLRACPRVTRTRSFNRTPPSSG